MPKSAKNTFYGGAAILTVSTIIVKALGALYKIPLGNILPDEVMADYTSAYNIYTVLLNISITGLPVAVSKCISEASTLGRRNQTMKIFRVAFTAFLAMGLLSFLCMTVFAIPVSNNILQNPKAVYCVLALSPSVLCVCLMSPLRGFFQGHLNMWPTGVSQIIESFFKLAAGLLLAMYLVNIAKLPEYGSVGAILGVSIGSVVALVYLLFFFFRSLFTDESAPSLDEPDSSKTILATLLKLAIPITISSAASALVTLIDGRLVMSQLTDIFHKVDGLALNANRTGPALDAARAMYGIYGKTLSIYNLPFAMMAPLTASIIPAVSACLSRRDRPGAKRISESAVRVGLIIALPMGMGLFALGGPIMGLLFPAVDTNVAGPLLSTLGLASAFVSLQLLCNSILQANGMVNLPIIAVVIGGIVKILVNYILVGNPAVRIYGAPIGTLCCFAVVAGLEIFFIRRTVPAAPRFSRTLVKPLAASLVMAASAWASHGLLDKLLRCMDFLWKTSDAGERYFSYLGSAISTAAAILIGVAVYIVLILTLHAIAKEDLTLMPKGDKIAKILRMK